MNVCVCLCVFVCECVCVCVCVLMYALCVLVCCVCMLCVCVCFRVYMCFVYGVRACVFRCIEFGKCTYPHSSALKMAVTKREGGTDSQEGMGGLYADTGWQTTNGIGSEEDIRGISKKKAPRVG